MRASIWATKRDRASFMLFAAFLLIAAFTGGSSRSDDPPQLIVRLTAVLFGAVALARLYPGELRALRAPVTLLLLLIGLMSVQLIPLPPAIWTALPGREPFISVASLAGMPQPWRPLSLTPDLTLNALVSLTPPLATLLLLAPLRRASLAPTVGMLFLVVVVTALVGLLQANDAFGNLYNYRVAGFPGASGLFSNRNHQALFLACGFPLLAALAARQNSVTPPKFALIAALSLFLLLMIMATGSRAGLVLGVLALGLSAIIYSVSLSREHRTRLPRTGRPLGIAALGLILVPVVGVVFLSRAGALQRLFAEDVSQEIRLRLFFPMLDLARVNFPVGSGFGSFVDVFKAREQIQDLSVQYLNHAHNDWIELAIEGGVPALLLAGGALIWGVTAALSFWRVGKSDDEAVAYGRVGSVVLALAALASFADYPLRTPLVMILVAVAAAWVAIAHRATRTRSS